MSLYKGKNLIAGSLGKVDINCPYSLFDSKYSDLEIKNTSWLLSIGQWNSVKIYKTSYTKLYDIYKGNETLEGISVKLSSEAYTDFDFVINLVEQTFRLPLRIRKRFVIDTFRNGHNWYRIYNDGWCEQGLFVSTTGDGIKTNNLLKTFKDANYTIVLTQNSTTTTMNNNAAGSLWITTKTPNSFTIADDLWGSGSYVLTSGYLAIDQYTPPKLYFYIGETIQNPNLINAAEVLNQLSKKMDATEINQIKTLISSKVGMPNYSAAIGISIPYTAPSNGFVYGGVNCIDAGRYVYVNGKMVHGHCGYSGGKWVYSGSLFEVNKGDVVTCDYTSGNYYFYPMKG